MTRNLMKSEKEQWSKPLGKSLLISQLNQLVISLPNPKSNTLKVLNNILINILFGFQNMNNLKDKCLF